MKSFISEDDIEQAICNRLSQPEYGWKRIECDPSVEKQDDVSATGRRNVSECILPEVFRQALCQGTGVWHPPLRFSKRQSGRVCQQHSQ